MLKLEDLARSVAPDESTFHQARTLAKSRVASHGASYRAVWGTVNGDDETSYSPMIDLRGEFCASCGCGASGKACVHVLAVLLRRAGVSTRSNAEPREVAEWLDSRNELLASREQFPLLDAAKRDRHVLNMLEPLQKKLEDAFRLGLGSSAVRRKSFWSEFETMAVDAHAQGLIRFTTGARKLLESGDLGQAKLGWNLGKLALLLEAFRNVDSANADYASEIRQAFGYQADEADVLFFGERVEGLWLALGRTLRTSAEGVGLVALDWFMNLETGRFAYVVQEPLESEDDEEDEYDDEEDEDDEEDDEDDEEDVPAFPGRYVDGAFYSGAAHFYPGTLRERVVFESGLTLTTGSRRASSDFTLDAFFQKLPSVLSRAPWVQTIPAFLDDVVARPYVCSHGGERVREWFLVSRSGASAPVVSADGSDTALEDYFSETWDSPGSVFAEWNGREFVLINVWKGEKLVTSREVASAKSQKS